MKQEIANLIDTALQDLYGLSTDNTKSLIEILPNFELGDFALPCFTLALCISKAKEQ